MIKSQYAVRNSVIIYDEKDKKKTETDLHWKGRSREWNSKMERPEEYDGQIRGCHEWDKIVPKDFLYICSPDDLEPKDADDYVHKYCNHPVKKKYFDFFF